MRPTLFCTYFFILLVLSVFSCSNASQKSRKPIAKISVLPGRKTIFTDDSIRFTVNIKLRNGVLEKSELFLNNTLLETSKETDFSYTVAAFKEVGKYQLKVVSTKTDGVEGVNFYTFEVLSDLEPESYTYEIVKEYPHNTDHFTQGLEIKDGVFYEGTGENGKSGLFQFDLHSGKILRSAKLEDQHFGEGITILNDKIYQLTYRSQKGFIYDLHSFARIDSFSYKTPEGWGLTNDGEFLLKTDGSEFVEFINPANMQVEKRIAVYDNKGPVRFLNELEYDKGYLYANVYTTNFIVKIDLKTGKVVSRINLDGLLSTVYNPDKPVDVLNGIAIDRENGKIYVTGKLWPKIFEIRLVKTA